ncbi:retrovirus-related pol polyprotein from transposon TNT 1-94 [Tanacetum coccineum]
MLNKDNYVPWSSRLLRYAKSKPNGKLIYNSIMHGSYVRRMIPKPGDPDRDVLVAKTFHEQTDDELTNKEVKQMEAHDSCKTAQEIWLRVQQIMKGSDIRVQEKKAKLFNEWERFTSTDGEPIIVSQSGGNQEEVNELREERHAKTHDLLALMAHSQNPYNYLVFHQDQPSPTYLHATNTTHTITTSSSISSPKNYMQQPMLNPEDISDPTTAINIALVLIAKAFKLNYTTPTNNNQRILSNPHNRLIDPTRIAGNQNGYNAVQNVGNQVFQNAVQNPERAKGNANGNNSNQIRCYNYKGLGHYARNCIAKTRKRGVAFLQTQLLIAEKEEAGIQLQAEEFDFMVMDQLSSAKTITTLNEEIANLNNHLSKEKSTVSYLQQEKKKLKSDFKIREDELLDKQIQLEQKIKELDNILNSNENGKVLLEKHDPPVVYDSEETLQLAQEKADESLAKHMSLEYEIERLLRAVVSQDIMLIVQINSIVECKYDKISYDKAYNDMQQNIEQLQAQLGDHKGKSQDTPCVSDTLDPLSQKLEDENLRAQLFDKVSKQKNTTKGTSANTKFANQSTLKKPSLQPLKNDHVVRKSNASQSEPPKFSKTRVPPKVVETDDLSNPVTSNSVPTTKESQVMKNEKVIASGMLRINPSKTSREDKFMPIKQASASVRTKPITVSQPHVITKKDINSDSNGLSSTGVDNTAKTRRPQPRSNTKTDRVPSASKSSCIKNKEVEVEEYHRNLLLSKNKKHMSSECNNIKLAIRNDNSEVVCAVCKKYLITANHDVCVLNYVNDMNSHADNQNAKVLNTANQKKHKEKVKNSKKLGSKERLPSPKPTKPRICLRWSPTRRIFDCSGKLIESCDPECQSDSSKGDNACTSNLQEPTTKRFPNSTSLLGRLSKFVYGALTQFLGTVRFGNDHIAAILGYGDLQWGNILITMVYFVEGLGHNLFSVGQFCDSDLEVAFRRNTCFVINLEGGDLLKGNRTINLYTINLHEMASSSPIFLIARATSTKSWLWHQRLSHLNFDTINDLAKNDLVTGLLKFKYHKKHICPSCEQGKSKKASHPPKPVPNSKQRLHLLHMDLCSPMIVESFNGKRYVLVIMDDYSLYTWVYFLRSKDEAPEEIKTFLKKIKVLLQALVIIVRTDNGIEFKNQVLKYYFDQVRISHQTSYVKTPQQNGVVEQRNRTLVEATRTMLIFSCAPLFLWAKAIATACYTQNRSIIRRRFDKTPCEPINGKKLDISFLHVFGALCYPKNDHEDIGKLGAKGLDLTYAPSTITSQKPTERELELLFEAMHDDYLGGQPSAATRTAPDAPAPQVLQTPTASTTTANTALTPTNSSSQAANIPNTSQEVDELQQQQQHIQQQDD